MSDFLEQEAGYGLDSISANQMKLPFLIILQPLSPQVIDGPDKIEGAKAGDLFNTVTQEIYGNSIDLIVLRFEETWLEWKPRNQGGGLVDRHQPGSISVEKVTFSDWKYNGNNINDTFTFICLNANKIEDGPIVLSLYSTGLKHAKNWNTLLRMQRLGSGKPCPIFGTVWHLETCLNKNDSGTWFQFGSKSTAIKKLRLIDENEYTQFVSPAIKLIESTSVDYASISDNAGKEDIDNSIIDLSTDETIEAPY